MIGRYIKQTTYISIFIKYKIIQDNVYIRIQKIRYLLSSIQMKEGFQLSLGFLSFFLSFFLSVLVLVWFGLVRLSVWGSKWTDGWVGMDAFGWDGFTWHGVRAFLFFISPLGIVRNYNNNKKCLSLKYYLKRSHSPLSTQNHFFHHG